MKIIKVKNDYYLMRKSDMRALEFGYELIKELNTYSKMGELDKYTRVLLIWYAGKVLNRLYKRFESRKFYMETPIDLDPV